MTLIIDRRQEPERHKFGQDKARFLHRIRDAVKKAVQDQVTSSSVSNIGKGGVKIPVPKKVTQEPVIHHKQGPNFNKVFPGNLYDVGDIVEIPPGGGGGGGSGNGSGASDGPDDNDDFVWISEKEFLDIFFEGRSLPDMIKLHKEANTVMDRQRAGFINRGPSHKLDMNITNQKRRNEQVILNKVSEKRMMKNFQEQYDIYRTYEPDAPEIDLLGKSKAEQLKLIESVLERLSEFFTVSAGAAYKNPSLSGMFNCVSTLGQSVDSALINEQDQKRLDVLQNRLPEQIKTARDAKKFQNHHMTYKFDDEVPKPAVKAVMICKMDVSGSMGQHEKNTAKAFFFILNQFLRKNYEEVDLVFITHTTTAKEVEEEEFFYGQRTGGTLVSSCLEKELEIINERYNTGEWNIYSVQASDGDNMQQDNRKVAELMREVMPLQQASYFIEVRDPRWGSISELHKVYKALTKEIPHLHTASINSPSDAIDAFKSFFPVGGAPAPANDMSIG